MSTTTLTYEDFLARATVYVKKRDRYELEATILLARLIRQAWPTGKWLELQADDITDHGTYPVAVLDTDLTDLSGEVRLDVDTALGGEAADRMEELVGWIPEGGLWLPHAGEWITLDVGRLFANGEPRTYTHGAFHLDLDKALAIDVEAVLAMSEEEESALTEAVLAPYLAATRKTVAATE